MTVRTVIQSFKNTAFSIILLVLTLLFALLLSEEVSEYVRDGLEIAVRRVIPTSLPFMIISDLYVEYGRPENIRLMRRGFTALFGINEYGLGPFICGNICGFPIGAKMCADRYSSGLLTKEEAERLIPLANNPSCAFVIGGVGAGIYGDVRAGVLLLISVYAATVIAGIVTRRKNSESRFIDINVNHSYDFVASVKNSGVNSISIISFISLFSVINGIVKKRIENAWILYPISAFLEVTNAIKTYSSSLALSSRLSLTLSAFALGFGGVCVGLQSAVFTSLSGLSMKRYYPIKLLVGILSASVFSILYTI